MKLKLTPQQKISLRLQTKPPVAFKDKKKEQNKNACRGKVKNEA